jgi:acetyl esterase/lipase
MHLPRRPHALRRPAGRSLLLAPALAVAALLVAACAPAPTGGVPNPNPLRSTLIANHYGSHLEMTRTDVAYGLGPQHRLDVLESSSPSTRGTIVFVHGGAFLWGDKSQLLGGEHGAIVHQHTRGWDLVSVGYTRGQNTYPAGYHDVALAVSWVKAHGASIGLDTSKVVLAGHSAGATLATMVATTPGATTPYGTVPRVDSWLAVSGLHDFVNGGAYITDPWGLPASHRPLISPLAQLDRGDPRGYLIHGDGDPMVRPMQSDHLHQKAALVGADVRYDLVDTGPASCRRHEPLCGANIEALNSFLS